MGKKGKFSHTQQLEGVWVDVQRKTKEKERKRTKELWFKKKKTEGTTLKFEHKSTFNIRSPFK